MDRSPPPSLLPILRSQKQGEILYLLLGNPELELGVSEISERLDIPYASVHREIERAQSAGITTSRKIGRTRLITANTASPYFSSLADLLAKAFGPASILAAALDNVAGLSGAFIFGSWAAAYRGQSPDRPVGDIDLLVLGEPDRDVLYAELSSAEVRLGREVQVIVRDSDWLQDGEGTFHANVTTGTVVELDLSRSQTDQAHRR